MPGASPQYTPRVVHTVALPYSFANLVQLVDVGLLIPRKLTIAEAFKPRSELLIGDRGGSSLCPKLAYMKMFYLE